MAGISLRHGTKRYGDSAVDASALPEGEARGNVRVWNVLLGFTGRAVWSGHLLPPRSRRYGTALSLRQATPSIREPCVRGPSEHSEFLHTYNYDYARVTLNGGQVVYEPDGSWTIVVAHRDPGHPNWVSTAGHPRGADLVPVVPSRRDAGAPADAGGEDMTAPPTSPDEARL